MKQILYHIIFFYAINAFSQQSQYFTKQFETSSGIYGYVKITTQPSTVGEAYLWIQQDAVVVEGIRTNGNHFYGNTLSNYGVQFPFECSNCYFYADGEASMVLNGVVYYGNFNKGGSINRGGMGKTNQTVHFSQSTRELHDRLRSKNNVKSYWETTGKVYTLNIHNVSGADFGSITRAAEKYVTAFKKQKRFDELISDAGYVFSKTPQERLSLLNQAKQYAQTAEELRKVERMIAEVNKELEKERLQTIAKKEKAKADKIRKEKSAEAYKERMTKLRESRTKLGNSYSDGMSLAKSIRDEAAAMRPQYQFELDYQRQMIALANELENNLVKPSTYILPGVDGATGSYNAQISQYKSTSNYKYQKRMATINAISQGVQNIIGIFQQQAAARRQREAIARQRAEEERERKRLFNRQASDYRREYKKFVNGRKKLFSQTIPQKSTLDKDGSDFKPIFMYYAFVEKGYDYYYENVSYPNTLNFKIKEEAIANFSPIYGVFPQINGQYPLWSDIQSKILSDYFPDDPEKYDIIFFAWEENLDDLIESLKSQINASVSQYYYSKALPSTSREIIFINDKMTADKSIDYWNGGKVKKKQTEKINYFEDSKKKTTSKKVDYWNTPKKEKKQPKKKKDSLIKIKKLNYWDN